ncbi:hypothetical protein ACET3Z_002756 [Daucus carota]
MGDDKWAVKALKDDSIVVSLLLQIKQHHNPFPSSLRWGHRQLRSKQTHTSSATRCSPTTPLSWSASDTSAPRSKATCAYEAGTSTSKKSRKKKTFTELREEESYLMNERVHLEKELASVNVTLNEQRYRGDNLKRIKLDFHVPSTNEIPAIRDEPMRTMFFQYQQSKASSDNQNSLILPRQEIDNCPEFSSSCKLPKDNKSRERCFILPDLNMAPAEDPGCDSLF